MAVTTQPSAAVARQLQAAETLCARQGRRLTPIRRQVLSLLLQRQRSLKAYELLDLMRDSLPGATPPTIYRALDFLVETGLVHRLDAINAWAACVDVGGEPHDLLVICTECGALAQLSDPDLTRQLADRAHEAGFTFSGRETELQATCAQCKPVAHVHHPGCGHHHDHNDETS